MTRVPQIIYAIALTTITTLIAAPAWAEEEESSTPNKWFDFSHLNWKDLGFGRSFEMFYGQAGTASFGPYWALGFNARQDILHIAHVRGGAFGFTGPTGLQPNVMPGYGIRGDVLLSTGGLLPGIEPYVGVGGAVYSVATGASVQMLVRPAYVMGVRALFFQAESRYETYPTPSGGLFGGIFMNL